MFRLICYDTPSDKRRRKLHKVLKNFAVPVQESVFETFLDEPEFQRLVGKLEKIIDGTVDSVRIYGLSRRAWRQMKIWGLPGRLEDLDHHLVKGGLEAEFRPSVLEEEDDDLPEWL